MDRYPKQLRDKLTKCRRGDTMRLFIAVNFDRETKRKLIAVQKRLKKVGPGNFSPPENLHLTLAFLGEVPPDRTAVVKRAMEQTAVPDLILTFDHAGCFQRDGGDVWWVGLAENRALLEMRMELCGHLSAAGFKLESRRFAPHITLARQPVTNGPQWGAVYLIILFYGTHIDLSIQDLNPEVTLI
ncbi:MAG: RNA 2',3'-cyclic phosphodiesterase [Bacillota bacterium]